MKKITVVVSVILLVLAIKNADLTVSCLPESVRTTFARLALPFKIARLTAKQPDLKLIVPVEGVTTNQITDT